MARWRTRRLAPALAVLAGALAFVGAVGAPATAAAVGDCTAATAWPANRQAYADEVVRLVNAHRASLNLPALKVSPTLTGSAVWKARHMAYYRYMAHDDPDPPVARTWYERVQACGYSGSGAGENIAYGYSTPAAVMSGWLKSDGHRRNIENPNYRVIGVGAAGETTIAWTQNFGTTDDSGAPSPSDTTPPTAPTGLTATALSATQLSLRWNASTDNVAVAGYRVYRNGTLVGSTTSTSYTDGSAAPATGYSYTVRAYDAAGNTSASSTTASVTTPSPTTGGTTKTVSATGYLIQTGSLRSGTAAALAVADGSTLDINASTYARAVSWYGRLASTNALTSLSIRYIGSASATCAQTVSLYNWSTYTWTTLATQTVGTTPVTITANASGTLAAYVSGTTGNGEVRVRIRCSRTDSAPFYTRADLLSITYAAS